MNDADRLIAIPEEIIFHSYILRIIDHLKFNYDPKFNKAWTNDESCPDIFKEDVDLIEFAQNMIPVKCKPKNLEYLTYLAYYAGYYWTGAAMAYFVYPEGTNYITPENIGDAEQRFPEIHGTEIYNDIISSEHAWEVFETVRPINLTGEPVFTFPKYYVAKMFDLMLDSCNAYVIRDYSYYNGPEEDFYKITDLYCIWNFKTLQDGEIVKEYDSRTRNIRMTGYFGWKLNVHEEEENKWTEETLKFHLEIHSKSELRYKYIILCQTESYDYGGCPYDFVQSHSGRYFNSVIYESPGWCLGNSVFDYEFKPGPEPDDDTAWNVTMRYPFVIIYPEYPDRLKELCEGIGVKI